MLLGGTVGSVLAGIIAVALVLPAGASAAYTPYYYEHECFNKLEKCWATNITPESGEYGNQSRIDDLDTLPTADGNGLSYGGPNPNSCSNEALPATGGDYPWGGGDSFCGQKCAYPEGVSCNQEPSQFVTQDYADTNGGWHFAMGGAGQCESNGPPVPCNFGHRFYPYDCSGYNSKCTSTSFQDMPFSTAFPGEMHFEMSSRLFVGGSSGPWHAFLCVVLQDAPSGAVLQMCDEPWNSGGTYKPVQGEFPPCAAGSTLGQYWQAAGDTTAYMTTNYSPTKETGVPINVGWTMTREQFLHLLSTVHSLCPLVPDDEDLNNWKIYTSEDGIEEIGPAGYSAGVSWEESNETMLTSYQGTAHKVSGPPEAGKEPATEIQQTRATLNGTVTPHLADTHYYFKYGTTTGYGSTMPAPPGTDLGAPDNTIPVHATVTGLRPGTTYHFRLVASNEWGTVEGSDLTFTTPQPSLNGDKYADLVECNNNEYLAATSTGSSLNAPTAWSSWGCGPLTKLGDFTGDGKTDMIVPAGGNKWAVGVSNGTSFTGPGTQNWTEGLNSEPTWDGVADVNGDGKADLVTCKNNEYKVATSNGSSLNAPTTWSTWGCGPLVQLGDFTGDGKADMIVPAGGNKWAVGVSNGTSFNGPGTQNWTEGLNSEPTWDGVADVNGDGKADLVTCKNNEYKVATSNGSSLNAPTTWSTWGCSPLAKLGDFNGDGKADLAVPGAGNTWAVALSNGTSFNGAGSGTWLWGFTNSPAWDGAGDVNGGGKADLVECNNNEYLAATSTGSSLNAPTTWSSWGCGPLVQLGDFTGDGKTDMIVPAGGNKWAVGVSNGTSFTGPGTQNWTEGLNSEPTWDGVADVNGDGKADLVTCKNNEYKVATSNGSSLNAPTAWSSWGCGPLTKLGDFTGDGKTDMIVPAGGNKWAVGVSNGTSFTGPGTQNWTEGLNSEPTWDGVADVNGDGKADLVTCKNNEYKVATSNGSSLNAPTTWSTWGCGPLTRLADVNGDGKADLIAPGAGNTWAVALSNGTSFTGAGSGTWLWGFTNGPAWDGAG